jgi:hypothetical protein
MKYSHLIIITFCTLFFNSCIDESFEQDIPTITEFNTDGEEFFMKGTYDGQEFEIRHTNRYEKNIPTMGLNSYESDFIRNKENNLDLFETYITIGLYIADTEKLLDLLQPGEYKLYPAPDTEPEYIPEMRWFLPRNIAARKVNDTPNAVVFDENFSKIIISDFHQVDVTNDFGIDSDLTNTIYRVNGSFQTKLINEEDENPRVVDFIVEEFSMMFEEK